MLKSCFSEMKASLIVLCPYLYTGKLHVMKKLKRLQNDILQPMIAYYFTFNKFSR